MHIPTNILKFIDVVYKEMLSLTNTPSLGQHYSLKLVINVEFFFCDLHQC